MDKEEIMAKDACSPRWLQPISSPQYIAPNTQKRKSINQALAEELDREPEETVEAEEPVEVE